ncbi:MAG TPA: cofactor assembly of complex C subunit B [Cyanobacteria bacterium UBA11149]|nr:cofactor assembly of complex C subunit B [Cyanobacteria bacterium UBA11367]HBE60884.1 cofactor assembly of complex C subunit B [Cyanobacteria bacterium UBA11366]HBK62494.1 cofactor assembly of complex C subunit B [Cyanobacteria bacterium UBA11166]HBR74905.1 cofactor assembly of complex C subunit B [Cyanobacteria bacterium UBA11159]HBS72718.1 cofactor assembly of complex C subunit B [Cyanobacteria bacterium UBA11153]HBW91042.1 cofactor assembly of complex C subunit B [Cyanobacteria bacterium
MTTTILSSTFFLTLLLAVGLFFFIRASVKDRTEQVKLIVSEPEESLLERFQAYFDQRSYRIAALDRTTGQVTFQGFVRPSWFLAIFLTILAACCILCFSLVLSILYPTVGKLFLALILLSPGAGVFYWQGAGRTEEVCLKVEPFCDRAAGTECHRQQDTQSLITVTAHRDELEQLQQTLKLQPLPESYPS